MQAEITGSFSSACATRTFSRAAPKFRPHLKFSQCAHEASSPPPQPPRRSNSRINRSQRYWAAFKCPHSSVICPSSSSRASSEASAFFPPKAPSNKLFIYPVSYQNCLTKQQIIGPDQPEMLASRQPGSGGPTSEWVPTA